MRNGDGSSWRIDLAGVGYCKMADRLAEIRDGKRLVEEGSCSPWLGAEG